MSTDRGSSAARLTPRALEVTRHLLVHGPASRGRLGEQLQLSDSSMSRVARTLMRDGMVAEELDPVPGIGRPRQILSLVPGSRHVVGVTLTGDRAYAVACDLFGEVSATGEVALPAPVHGVVPPRATVEVVAGLVRRLGRTIPHVDGVGVSLGGVVEGRSRVVEGTFLGWRDVDLGLPLGAETGTDVVVTNDVSALAREQLWFGAGRTHATFGLVTVGAGLGYGVVRDGQVVERRIDNGHLLAHSPVDGAGPACSLGHRGCVAAYLNRDDLLGRQPADRRPGSLAELFADPSIDGERLLADAARALGHWVASVAGALQTERVVLAGEDVGPLFASPVLAATIADRLRPGPVETQRCQLEVSAVPLSFTDWARGAAVVAVQHVLGALPASA